MAIEVSGDGAGLELHPNGIIIRQEPKQSRRNAFQYLHDAYHGALDPRLPSVVADPEAFPKGTFPEYLSASLRNTLDGSGRKILDFLGSSRD